MQFGRFSTYTALSALVLNGFGFVQCESPFSPSNMTGLVAWYNADSMQTAPSIPGAQSGWVPRLGDDSGNQHSIATGANVNAPIYNATAVNGRGGLYFQSPGQNAYLGDGLANASTWTFLHNGTGCTVVGAIKPTTLSTGANCTIVNTTGSTSGRGVWIYYDGVNQRFGVILRNNTVQILNIQGAVNSSPRDAVYTVVFTYQEGLSPEAKLYVDGTLVASGNTSAAPSTDAPQFTGIVLGRLGAAGLNWLNGYIRNVYFYNRVLSTAEIATVSANSVALQSPRPIRRIWTVGDSLTVQDGYQHAFYLEHLLTTKMQIDFVGTLLAGEIVLFVDRQHNGYTAHTIQTISSQTDNLNINATPTDVIFMAGTNNTGQDITVTMSAYDAAIQQIVTQRPGATIWCMAPPRRIDTPSNETWMNTFRANVQAYAATNGYNYIDGDVLDNTQMSADGVHPNNTGYNYIGKYRVAPAFL